MGRFTDYRTFKTALGGRLLQFEIGKVCEQANGQVTVRYGETVVNCTATASKEPRQDIDFFPLSCDYEEKMYSVGKIPGGYIKREGKPGEKAILTSRLIDRPLRPLFPKGFRNDVVVVASAWCGSRLLSGNRCNVGLFRRTGNIGYSVGWSDRRCCGRQSRRRTDH